MTFLVNGIKERLEKKYNIEFLLWVESSLLAKKFLENSWIIVLSLKEYNDQNETFGNVHFSVPYQQQDITIILNMQGELPQICSFLFDIGLEVIDINFFKNPLPPEEIQKIIQQSQEESKKKTKEVQIAIQVQEEERKKIYTDERLGTDKEIIDRTFTKIKQITELAKWDIGGKELKLLSEKEDELKKLKLWTNHERIIELMNEVLVMLDVIENNYYLAHENKEKIIFEGTVVNEADFQKEIHKREKVQKLKEVGAKIKSSEQDYLVLGKSAIFLKFLLKDIKNLFTTPKLITNMLYNIYDMVEMAVLIVLILIQTYILADVIFLFSENMSHEFFDQRIIKIWVFGFLIWIARLIRKKDMLALIVLVPVIIILYIIIINIINNNFSI